MKNAGNAKRGTLAAFDDVSPIESPPPKGVKEHRKETRYKAAWKIDVVVEGQELHDGKIKDISLHGAAILIGRNLKPGTKVTLNTHIPPLNSGVKKVLTVYGKTLYTVHDSSDLCFRIGIRFDEFKMESDRDYLESRLTNYHPKA